MTGVWDAAGLLFSECVDRVVAMARRAYPDIHAGKTWDAPLGVRICAGQGWFCYEPATAESEDLLLDLQCAPADQGWFYDGNGNLLFPAAVGRHAIMFEIARGTGLTLASLEPVLLPEDEESHEYEAAVLDYVELACAFVDANTDLILDALRTPYQR